MSDSQGREATTTLRFQRRKDGERERFILQQAWTRPLVGEITWKDVPVVDEMEGPR